MLAFNRGITKNLICMAPGENQARRRSPARLSQELLRQADKTIYFIWCMADFAKELIIPEFKNKIEFIFIVA